MYIRIARIVNTFGIQGDIKVIAETDFPEERFEPGSELSIIRNGVEEAKVTIKQARQQKGTYIISLEEFNNINQVEGFKGAWLAILEEEQQDLPEGEFYHHQIIGLEVHTTEGKYLGKIKEILPLGPNDVWVIKRHEPHLKDALIPYIDDVVKEVDLANQSVQIQLMEGLIDDAD